jgi:Putative amidoligase enzyme
MVRYRDNPKLNLKVITTISGEKEYRKNCRKIKNNYCVIDRDCVKIDNTWYATTSKIITFDHEKQIYVIIKKHPLIYGLVGTKKNGEPIFGYFTENKYNNILVRIKGYGNLLALNQKLLESLGFIEDMSTGVWYFKKGLSASAISKFSKIDNKRIYKDRGYNIEDNTDDFESKKNSYTNYPLRVSKNAVRFAKFLGNITYGLEIETSTGYLPENIQYQTGVVICRDGSIDNAEYVTVPMRGAKGLQNIKYLSSELKKRVEIDLKCSFHIHIGNISDDRFFLMSLYALGIRLQDEIYTMFPYFKTAWEGIKKQDYNKKLRKLGIGKLKSNCKDEFKNYVDDAYCRLFKWLNDDHEPSDDFNRNNHRHRQTAKWNRKQRYYWINFMNMFFSERKTIEFRLHQATVNHYKMINWLFICNAIIKYAEFNAKSILSSGDPIKLDNVLDFYKNHYKTNDAELLSNYLKTYVNDRKSYFEKDRKNKDYTSIKELETDKDYEFKYDGTELI